MAQRAALARCLARKPEILLLDELRRARRSDPYRMQDLLLKVMRDFHTAAILITHDIDEVLLISDRILLLGGTPARVIGSSTYRHRARGTSRSLGPSALKFFHDCAARPNGASTKPVTQRRRAEPRIVKREPRRRPAKKAAKAKKRTKDNTVFVVHGRDGALRQSMFDFLRGLNLHPLEWDHAIDEARQGNPYVGDVLDIVMEKADVVLFTPDDLAQLKEQFVKGGERASEGKLQGQARPNVLFEAGLALGAHPKKTVMVQVGRLQSFSDIGGRHMVRLSNDEASRKSFANRLARICLAVNRVGNDWMHVGRFEPTEPKPAKKKVKKAKT